jgi:hypothetical protein
VWAALLPVLLPIVESAGAALLGYAIAQWAPSLGLSPTTAAALATAVAKLAPTNVTAKIVPIPGESRPGAEKSLPVVP